MAIVEKGVGKTQDRLPFYAAGLNPGGFTFVKETSLDSTTLGTLEITTLDVFAESHGWFDSKPSIGIFKLDVEGFELEVIEGAERLLRSGIIEYIAIEIKKTLPAEKKLLIASHLMEAGYSLALTGSWRGPRNKVTDVYTSPSEVVTYISTLYGDNFLFKSKHVPVLNAF